jgi:hypothetical protein
MKGYMPVGILKAARSGETLDFDGGKVPSRFVLEFDWRGLQ